MPVTARLSSKFYERFGDDIATELVDWFNAVDSTYQTQLREINDLNWERFKATLLAESASIRGDVTSGHADLRGEFRTGVADLRTEFRTELAGLRMNSAPSWRVCALKSAPGWRVCALNSAPSWTPCDATSSSGCSFTGRGSSSASPG